MSQTGIKKNMTSTSYVALCSVCGINLLIHNLLFPARPLPFNVPIYILQLSIFTVKKYEDVVVKNCE